MGFLKSIGSALASPATALGGASSSGFGGFLAGVPLIGEGFAMEDQQAFNSAEATKNRDFTSSEAEKNRQFQRYMSNTAYQRQTNDLEKAGLNRILGMSGVGASTPSGATAQGSQATSGIATPSGATAKTIELMHELTDAKIDKIRSETENTDADTLLKGIQGTKIKSDEDLNRAIQNLKEVQLGRDMISLDLDKKYSSYERLFKLIESGTVSLKNATSIVKEITGSILDWKKFLFNKNKPTTPKPLKKKVENYGPKGEHKSTRYEELY